MTWNQQRVRQLRRDLGLTQVEFAQALGCRQQTVSEWELGLYEPANAYARLLSDLRTQRDLSGPVLHQVQRNANVRREVAKGPKTNTPSESFNDAEVADETKIDDSQLESDSFSFDKPFDPAID